ncbi:MAG: YjbF family lipoprotein [Pseudomonas profundi]|uniref:YjbF family lipoprotein n=1 Tax=Pseudomonas profundi TaxID=1981513 RepID=UPI00300356C4
MDTLLRAGLLAFVAVLLNGCSSLAATSYETIRLAIAGPDSVITTDYVNSLDRPALSARLKQSEALLILASGTDGIAEWHGLSQALVTQNGRVIQSAGLPEQADVIAPLLPDDPFLRDLRTLETDLEVTRQVDLPARYLTGVPQRAQYRTGPLETRQIMGVERELLRLDETISMRTIGFKAVNHYWLDQASGKVVASTQHLAPDLPALHLVELHQTVKQP